MPQREAYAGLREYKASVMIVVMIVVMMMTTYEVPGEVGQKDGQEPVQNVEGLLEAEQRTHVQRLQVAVEG